MRAIVARYALGTSIHAPQRLDRLHGVVRRRVLEQPSVRADDYAQLRECRRSLCHADCAARAGHRGHERFSAQAERRRGRTTRSNRPHGKHSARWPSRADDRNAPCSWERRGRHDGPSTGHADDARHAARPERWRPE